MAKQKLAPTPQLKPGTYSAIQVLRFVQRIVKQEPRRLYMPTWMLMLRGRLRQGHWLGNVGELPMCKTAACEAGWINIVTGHEQSNRKGAPGVNAITHLGLNPMQQTDLGAKDYGEFLSPAAKALDGLFAYTEADPATVNREVDHIINTHRAELRKAKVVVERKARG